MIDDKPSSEIETIAGFHELAFPIFSDLRGFFRTWYTETSMNSLGINFKVMQSNISKSKKGVIRGIHFSDSSYEQSKIITCIQGAIADVAIDLRRDSSSFGKQSNIVLDGHSLTLD